MINKNNSCTFYLVRHGETEWNVRRLLQGQSDIPMNKTGEKQAEEVGARLRKIHFDAVYSSDLIRARRTAEIIVLEKKIAVQTTEALRERNFGTLEKKSWITDDKKLTDLWERLDTISKKERKERGLGSLENSEELMNRFIPFIRELAVAYKGKTVLLVSHGSLIRVFLIHLGYGTMQTLPSGSIKNTSYIKLLSDGVEFEIEETVGIKRTASI